MSFKQVLQNKGDGPVSVHIDVVKKLALKMNYLPCCQ